MIDESDDGWAVIDGRRISKTNRIKDIYENIRWCWVALALASLVLQATRTAEMSDLHNSVLNQGELVLTIVFDIEIVVRVLAHLPDWRSFFKRGQNLLDLILALGSSIIQIPAIHNSGVYSWLTILQLIRFYRVILEIPRMKPLLVSYVIVHLFVVVDHIAVSSIREYVWFSEHVPLSAFDQLSCCAGGRPIATRRYSLWRHN